MLSLAVIQRKEEGEAGKEGKRKDSHFWMNFSTATWTLSIISLSLLQFSCHMCTLLTLNTQELFGKNCLQLLYPKFDLFYALNRPIPCNSTVSNGFVFLLCFSFFLSVHLQDCFIFDVWTYAAVGWGSWVCLD